MNTQIMAVFIQEGTRLLSEFLRIQPVKHSQLTPPELPSEPPPTFEPLKVVISQSATPEGNHSTENIKAGCLPCAAQHLGTCAGVLNEAVRFVGEGLDSPEVVDRITICTNELNAMERVDLRPEKIINLPGWEKTLVDETLTLSRETRHAIEGLSTKEDLEKIAAKTQTLQRQINQAWMKKRLENLSPPEREEVNRRVEERLKEEQISG